METFLLGSMIAIVLFFIIYSSLKTKKIYSENVEYEPKNEDEIKRIEKRLKLKGFSFKAIQKYEYYYLLNGSKEKILLPRIRIYSKKFRNYGLIINNANESIKNNILLKKQVMEFLHSKKIDEIIIFNEKTNDFEFIKSIGEKSKYIYVLLIIILIFLSIYLLKYYIN